MNSDTAGRRNVAACCIGPILWDDSRQMPFDESNGRAQWRLFAVDNGHDIGAPKSVDELDHTIDASLAFRLVERASSITFGNLCGRKVP